MLGWVLCGWRLVTPSLGQEDAVWLEAGDTQPRPGGC